MPELPEVQVMVNDLNLAHITGQTLKCVRIHWPAAISGLGSEAFAGQVTGRAIASIYRKGKFILFKLDNAWVMAVHLRMSGRFMLVKAPMPRPRHVQVELGLDDGRRLWFHDTRKFGRFYLASHARAICGHLGLEPLSRQFSRRALGRLLSRHRRQLKPMLLDQTLVAGLGNIYVDEALWAAALHPLRLSHTLVDTEALRLHRAIRQVLRQGLQNAGTSLGSGQNNFVSLDNTPGANASRLKVYRRTGHPCPRCAQPIQRLLVGQRSTHICPVCQSL